MIEESASRRAAAVRRMTEICGIISQFVGLTALFVAAISSSPWFSWTEEHR